MKSLTFALLAASIFLAARGILPAQPSPPTVDGYVTAAKVAAGTDNKVKYVILSHAHGDHDGGAPLVLRAAFDFFDRYRD